MANQLFDHLGGWCRNWPTDPEIPQRDWTKRSWHWEQGWFTLPARSQLLWRLVTLRIGGSVPKRLLGAGSALLLVCGIASAQSSHKPTRPKAKAKLQTVSSPSTSRSTFAKNRKLRKKVRQRGQQKIDAARAREIQQALIREHYMDGEASGVWDAKSQDAMVRFQADNGWQSKVVPDSRALIKLGLGPDHEHLLNPENAMTSQPQPPRASPMLNQSPAMITPPR